MTEDPEAQFCSDYWAWLKSAEQYEPPLASYGLPDSVVQGLKRQCQIEWQAQQRNTDELISD